jgi:hypothetical protein
VVLVAAGGAGEDAAAGSLVGAVVDALAAAGFRGPVSVAAVGGTAAALPSLARLGGGAVTVTFPPAASLRAATYAAAEADFFVGTTWALTWAVAQFAWRPLAVLPSAEAAQPKWTCPAGAACCDAGGACGAGARERLREHAARLARLAEGGCMGAESLANPLLPEPAPPPQ